MRRHYRTTLQAAVWLALASSVLSNSDQPARSSLTRLKHHLKDHEYLSDLKVIDAATNMVFDPSTDEDYMPNAMVVTFLFDQRQFILEVEKVPVVLHDRYQELVVDEDFIQSTTKLSTLAKSRDNKSSRARRSGPRSKRSTMDCMYHGSLVNDTSSTAVISICELPLRVHAIVSAPDSNLSIEIQPFDEGESDSCIASLYYQPYTLTHSLTSVMFTLDDHFGFYLSNVETNRTGPCRTRDFGSFHDDIIVVPRHHHHRSSRDSCVKIVEVLLVNDAALHNMLGRDTEMFSAQIFSIMHALYVTES